MGGIMIACNNDDNGNGNDDDGSVIVTQAEVVANYANIVYQNYLDSYNSALTMQTAINAFVDTPSEELFTAAKTAWLDAREPYGQSEVFRGSNGPVDTEESANAPWTINNEGQMNAWPMDESYVDYVEAGTEPYAGDFNSIISDTDFEITEQSIAAANEGGAIGDEKAISTGWHAIEFLLWGQDNTSPSEVMPGQRAYTDYTTADNADRRGQYLRVATELLIADLKDLVDTWNEGGAYRRVFEGLEDATALQQALTGAFFIAGDELSGERMLVAVDSTDGIDGLGQEDEHSCFSDNTHRDIVTNALGVYNVVFGKYNSIEGASFYDLVMQADATQAAALKSAADDAIAKVNAISGLATNNNQPFDLLITQESVDNGQNGPVIEAANALINLADEISASASTIDINLM